MLKSSLHVAIAAFYLLFAGAAMAASASNLSSGGQAGTSGLGAVQKPVGTSGTAGVNDGSPTPMGSSDAMGAPAKPMTDPGMTTDAAGATKTTN